MSNYPTIDPKLRVCAERLKTNRAILAGLEKSIKADQTAILAAMGDAPIAYCDGLTLMATDVAPAEPTVTLRSGLKLAFGEVVAIVTKNGLRISAADVLKLFGGRDSYRQLRIS